MVGQTNPCRACEAPVNLADQVQVMITLVTVVTGWLSKAERLAATVTSTDSPVGWAAAHHGEGNMT